MIMSVFYFITHEIWLTRISNAQSDFRQFDRVNLHYDLYGASRTNRVDAIQIVDIDVFVVDFLF